MLPKLFKKATVLLFLIFFRAVKIAVFVGLQNKSLGHMLQRNSNSHSPSFSCTNMGTEGLHIAAALHQ